MSEKIILENRTPKLGEGSSIPYRRLDLELPQGLTASLSRSPEATAFFGGLDDPTRGQIVAYIQSTDTGEEAKARVRKAVDGLERGKLDFLSR